MLLKNTLMIVLFFFMTPNTFAADSITAKIQTKPGTSPQRIVSVNLCTDELLLHLVSPERVAAVTKHSANPSISTVVEQTTTIKKIQGTVEDVMSCKADLLVGGRFSNKQTLHFFQYSEIPVLIFGVPKNFEDIYADIRKLAKAVGESEKGEQIIKGMEDDLSKIRGDIKSKTPKRAVFFQSGNYVPGSGTFENAIMEAAGLENIAVPLGIKEYGNLPLEKLIEAKPDVMIFAGDQKRGTTVRGEVLSHPAMIQALPDLKVVEIPSSMLNCGSPASIEAVRILVRETSV